MRRSRLSAGAGALVLLALALAACAPRLQPSGPFTEAPRIEGGALVARDGAKLPLRVWEPEGEARAVAVALHGFNDYAHAFDRPARAWAERGIVTYAMDQRGFGAAPEPGIWAGIEAMTDDLSALAAVARARHPGLALYLVGDSMGGAVVLTALARRDDLDPAGAVLIAPAVWGRDWLGPFKSGALWLSAHAVPWFRATAEGLGVTPSDNEEMLIALARDPLVIKATRMDAIWGLVNLMDAAAASASRVKTPVLLMYGTRDEVIPEEPTRAAIAALEAGGRARAVFYDGGYHMLLRDLGAEKPIADAAIWMLDQAQEKGAARMERRP